MNTVLVLMPRLSDYMLNCMKAWTASTGVELHIVRRNVDSSAPFQFESALTGIQLHQREDFDRSSLRELARDLDPSLILCFGWMDEGYLSVVRARGPECLAVMTMDNQWLGTLRQRIGLLWFRTILRPIFDHIWVPGARQRQFARKLGFSDRQIHEGLYVANGKNFDPIWKSLGGAPPTKRLIFVGRYAKEKGIEILWEAFTKHCDQTGSDLELWCIGTGPLDTNKPSHPQIKHLGFVQPGAFSECLGGGGIFVLPSIFEPWGLVVHEFTLAGCPLILSKHVGAADRFLGDDNGILLRDVSVDSLLLAISRVDSMNAAEIKGMADASRRRAEMLSLGGWVKQAAAFEEGAAA